MRFKTEIKPINMTPIGMKYMLPLVPFLIFLGLLSYLVCRSSECTGTGDHLPKPSMIKHVESKYFISEDGCWINHAAVKGFKVIEPWPRKYSVQVYIPWSSHCVKSGFQNRKEAEDWLIEFLQE